MARVTVILVSYNQSQYLREAVESVLGQTHTDLELIAIDNGSSDESQEILGEYVTDPRVVAVRHAANAPITARFNEGLDRATGDYIGFLYSDDLYLPTKLARQVQQLEAAGEEFGVAYAPAMGLNDRTGRRWQYSSVGRSGFIFDDLLGTVTRGHPDMISPLARKECFVRHRFNEKIFAEGEAIFFRIARTTKFLFDPAPVAVIRDHDQNAGKALARNLELNRLILASMRENESLSADELRRVMRYERMLLASYGWQGARLGAASDWTRGCLREALVGDPALILNPRTFGAVVLAWLPARARRALNLGADQIRRGGRQKVLVDDYGGSMAAIHGRLGS